MSEASTSKKKPTGRRPGRPPKTPAVRNDSEILGIAPAASKDENILEFAYSNPLIFKKIVSLLNNFEVDEIHFYFAETTAEIRARDHFDKSIIYINFDCNQIARYFCASPIRICVKREYLEKILMIIDRAEYKLQIIAKTSDYRSVINVMIRDVENDKDMGHEIETLSTAQEIDAETPDTDYQVQFVLDGKHFKTEIARLTKLSKILTFQKIGYGPLEFTFEESRKIDYCGRYNNPDKIRLQSTVKEDDIFRVSVLLGSIKPFSANCSANEVAISLDMEKRMKMSTVIDKQAGVVVARVTVYTNILTGQD